MDVPIRKLLIVVFITAAVLISGCATRKYVRGEIGQIEPQITEVRDAQSQQAERIDAVDRRANEGLNAANRATTLANNASEAATAADRRAANAERRADGAQQTAQGAMNAIETVESRFENRIANLDKYKVAEQRTVTFKFDSDELSKETLSKLDDLLGVVAKDQSGYLIELQGFTDNVGTEKYNFGLSGRRAESVMRYLVSKDIPLYRISIVGLGENKPVADNHSTAGREQNRRVDVRVLRTLGTVATANR
jgi:outer membrane protein OmpA-like peptidoglycan-associated protein